MIDITKTKSSIIRLVNNGQGTHIHQITDTFLKLAANATTDEEFKQEMYEILRFNPYICESFYADHVILVEGPTEEIVTRAYIQEVSPEKFFFILNCGTVTNIPFYQKILSRFSIPYSIICDTDSKEIINYDDDGNPIFSSGIQKSISDQFQSDIKNGNTGVLRCHNETFEPAHKAETIPENLRMGTATSKGKPYDANIYWKEILYPNIDSDDINKVPIILYLREILSK